MSQCHQLILEAYDHVGGLFLGRALLTGSDNNPDPQDNLPWCICRKCRSMPLSEENICFRNNPCITTTESFENMVLNREVFSVAIVHRSDVYSDNSTYEPSNYRKAACRQWTLGR